MKGDWIGSQRSKREPPSRPAAKPFCFSCSRAETEERVLVQQVQHRSRPGLCRRSLARARPTAEAIEVGFTKDGGELTSKPRRRHAPQLNSQAPIVCSFYFASE